MIGRIANTPGDGCIVPSVVSAALAKSVLGDVDHTNIRGALKPSLLLVGTDRFYEELSAFPRF